MAQQRSQSPPRKFASHSSTRNGVVIRRTYTLRHSPKRAQHKGPLSSHAVHNTNASLASRPVLVPVHFNLRRLPSRYQLMAPLRSHDSRSNASSDIQVGSKRKRGGGTNENAHIPTRGSRATGKFKRQRSQNDSSEEDILSQNAMDIDEVVGKVRSWSSELSDEEEALLDDCELPTCWLRFTHTCCDTQPMNTCYTRQTIASSIDVVKTSLSAYTPSLV